MQLQAGCDVVTDGELGRCRRNICCTLTLAVIKQSYSHVPGRRLSYIGIIAELAHGFDIAKTPDGRPFTVVTEKLVPKTEGIIANESARCGVASNSGYDQYRIRPVYHHIYIRYTNLRYACYDLDILLLIVVTYN
jgi:hypothetical protein